MPAVPRAAIWAGVRTPMAAVPRAATPAEPRPATAVEESDDTW